MSQKNLKTHSLHELIDLFERSSHAITDGAGQRLHGVPGWDLAHRAALTECVLKAWTERIGYAVSYPVIRGDEYIPVDLNEDDDPGRYSYRCPETFRTKYVAADLAAVYTVTATKFLNYLADLLGIPQARRRGITTPAIGGVLWNLGKMRIGNIHVDVWLARGLFPCIEQVFSHFQASSLPDQGLIFTTGQSLPSIVPPPRSYRVIPIVSVLLDYSVKPTFDIDMIHRLLVAPPGRNEEKSLPVRFDPFTNTLTIATKPDKPWAIKGTKQAKAVKHLFDQFTNGRQWVPACEILLAVYGSPEAAKGKRVASIFSGNTTWLDYIAGDGNGHYGFNLD